MKPFRPFVPFALLGAAIACGSVPIDTPPPNGRLIAPKGVIRGTVVYSGPHPCSSNGHIIGNALVLVFAANNPPPPKGLANTAINFGVVTGDVLFGVEPRNRGADIYCPLDHGITDTITVNAPFVIAPLDGASYILASFYDYTGDFLPEFKFRNLPEKGDVAGGDIDTVEALQPVNAGNPNFQPHFLPVNVGVPEPLPADAGPGQIPNFTIPDTGYVADNITVTIGGLIDSPRPYFYPQGLAVSFNPNDPNSNQNISTSVAQSSDSPAKNSGGIVGTLDSSNPNYAPVLTFPQDISVLASPTSANKQDPASVNNFEANLPHLRLQGGVPTSEFAAATAALPFHFQIPRPPQGGFLLWQNASFDPVKKQWTPLDSPDAAGVPDLWPFVVLTKLVDDPKHTLDPASLTQQGSASAPVVIIQAVTLLGGDPRTLQGDPLVQPAGSLPESLYNTGFVETGGAGFSLFNKGTGRPNVVVQDHVTVIITPAAICFNTLYDSTKPDKRGTIVTPHLTARSSDLPVEMSVTAPVVPPSILTNTQFTSLVNGLQQGCLPTGRYAINVVYPNGQAWTVPNEAGACSGSEGATNFAAKPPTCTLKPRAVLRSQGPRAVVEVVAAKDPTYCQLNRVPAVCLPQPQQ